jgi:uncharacterized protein DUF5657
MPEIINLFQVSNLLLIFKVLLLVLIFVYILFTFIIYNRVRALNRTIYLAAAHASLTLQLFSFISFLLAVSLFIATLVIV